MKFYLITFADGHTMELADNVPLVKLADLIKQHGVIAQAGQL